MPLIATCGATPGGTGPRDPPCPRALQVVTGPLSDRVGRKELVASGMIVQAGGIWLTVLVPDYGAWIVGAAIHLVAALTFASGVVVAWAMRRPRPVAVASVA